MNRRGFMRSGVVLSTAAVVGACSIDPDEQPDAGPPAVSPVLVAYFSRPGENYFYGDRTHLEVGNTQVVADMVLAETGADVFRIEAADPYPESYDDTVARNVREQDDDIRPVITPAIPSLDGYDTVLVGSPIWNVQPPMIMATFVEAADLAGKIVLPFVTYAVSELGNTIDFYTELCPTAYIGEGLAVRGELVRDAQPTVAAWLARNGLLNR